MKRIRSSLIIAIMTLIFVVVMLGFRSDSMNAKTNKLANIRNFICYYGNPELKAISSYELAIIEPAHYTREQIAELQKTTLTVAYISLGEAAPADAEKLFQSGAPQWYMDKQDGKQPDSNGDWGSVYADVSSPTWKKHVLERAGFLIGELGVDGLFFDTLDSVENYPENIDSMIELARSVRTAYPDKVLIANRGFSIYAPLSAIVDGFMFECFSSCYDFGKGKYRLFDSGDLLYTHGIYVEKLARFMAAGGVVLALDYASQTDTRMISSVSSRARDYGFLSAVETVNLDQPHLLKGEYDAAFVKKYGKTALNKLYTRSK